MAKEPDRIRAFNVYMKGTKIGTIENGSYTISGNDEMHVTAEGTSWSDGTITTEVTGNTIITVAGKTQMVTNAILKKEYVTVQVGIVDGQIHTIQMRCLEHKFDTDNKTGALKGSFKFGGGAPEIT